MVGGKDFPHHRAKLRSITQPIQKTKYTKIVCYGIYVKAERS